MIHNSFKSSLEKKLGLKEEYNVHIKNPPDSLRVLEKYNLNYSANVNEPETIDLFLSL